MKILGLMSGTSLDGVDLALCEVDDDGCRIEAADTVPYPPEWKLRLANLEHSSALEYAKANVELGRLFGQIVNDFIAKRHVAVEAIASHGHTIFHQPQIGLTTQIGDGDAIAAATRLPVVSNFRTLDVALGGQGAPLVPIGDETLFGQYDACLNLGGIANISYREGGKRVAFDICPCNMALNHLAGRLGMDYDPDGIHARKGRVVEPLLDAMDALDYYRAAPPKSLGKEWFTDSFRPLLDRHEDEGVDNCLCTVVEHIARQVARVVIEKGVGSMLITGGGAFNAYLAERFKALMPMVELTIPDKLIVNYKEAMIFAYLGYLRLKGRVNTLSSVTGAREDSVGGTISGLTRR